MKTCTTHYDSKMTETETKRRHNYKVTMLLHLNLNLTVLMPTRNIQQYVSAIWQHRVQTHGSPPVV